MTTTVENMEITLCSPLPTLFYQIFRPQFQFAPFIINLIQRAGLNMKTMTCKQLGGACDLEFHANSFEELAELSKQHGMEMFQKQDSEHLEAMQKIQELMQNPAEMVRRFEAKREEFNALPDDR